MKRNAATDLNHTNWDEQDEKEERGEFVTADRNVISQRKVIQARRKPMSTTTNNVFKSFGGFNEKVTVPFSISSNVNSFDKNKDKHLSSLKLLNQQFLECIQKHISGNPFCVLTPTLDDYQKNLLTIKAKYPLVSSSDAPISSSQSKTDTQLSIASNATPTLSFGMKDKVETDINTEFGSKNIDVSKPFIFPMQTSSFGKINVSESTIFGFSANSKTDANSTGFSNSSSLFGNGANSSISTFIPKETHKCDEEEEDYVPPVAEVREVKEQDSVYEVRCKLYYQQDKEWKLRGVGNLFIKPIDKGKFQLVIRADNSLATILLNVLINDMVPLTLNKNNVSLVTMTDFLKDIKPTPLLIRVKTTEAAEDLLAAMKKQL